MDRNDELNDDRRDDNDLQLNDPARSAARGAERQDHRLDDTQEYQADVAARDGNAPEVEGTGKQVAGEAAGGLGGAAAGAAVGTAVAGPIGTVIGAIAGAVGGWWAGYAATHTDKYTTDDDQYYRASYESDTNRAADRSYDDVRPAYQLGHIASYNPDYRGRSFEEVEADLQKGWTTDLRNRHGDWTNVRHYAQSAFSRRVEGVHSENPDLSPETPSERTVLRASETARDRLAGGRDGLRSDDTLGF